MPPEPLSEGGPDLRALEDQLREWLQGARSIVIAGIGNAIRRDDYVGVKVVEDLRDLASDRVRLIECETVPESFVDEIVGLRPTHVLLVDAALLGLPPGSARLYGAEQVTSTAGISTHTLPIRVFCEYVTLLTGARIALLLIQPKDTEFGEGISPEVQGSASKLESLLRSLLA